MLHAVNYDYGWPLITFEGSNKESQMHRIEGVSLEMDESVAQ